MRARQVASVALLALVATAGAHVQAAETATTRLYMRNDGGSTCPGTTYLADQPGANEPGCGYQGGAPLRELARNGAPVSAPPITYATIDDEERPPLTLDADGDMTGNVRVVATSQTQRNAVGQVRVDVTVRVTDEEGNTTTIGTSSSTKTITPGTPELDFPFTLAVADSLDNTKLTGVTAEVDIRGWHVLTGYHRLNGTSYLNVPFVPALPSAGAGSPS